MRSTAVIFVCGLLAGASLYGLLPLLSPFWSERQPLTPCVDIFSGPPQPIIYSIPELHQGDYGRKGLAHVTIAGARHHGMRRVEVWLQTFAPGVCTPLHRHACEEVFVIQRGGGAVHYRASDGSVEERRVRVNDTLVIPPNLVHQIVNSGEEDLQALVVFDSPPVDIYTFANWSKPEGTAVRVWPYFWDKACPPMLPAALQQLVPLEAAAAAASEEL